VQAENLAGFLTPQAEHAFDAPVDSATLVAILQKINEAEALSNVCHNAATITQWKATISEWANADSGTITLNFFPTSSSPNIRDAWTNATFSGTYTETSKTLTFDPTNAPSQLIFSNEVYLGCKETFTNDYGGIVSNLIDSSLAGVPVNEAFVNQVRAALTNILYKYKDTTASSCTNWTLASILAAAGNSTGGWTPINDHLLLPQHFTELKAVTDLLTTELNCGCGAPDPCAKSQFKCVFVSGTVVDCAEVTGRYLPYTWSPSGGLFGFGKGNWSWYHIPSPPTGDVYYFQLARCSDLTYCARLLKNSTVWYGGADDCSCGLGSGNWKNLGYNPPAGIICDEATGYLAGQGNLSAIEETCGESDLFFVLGNCNPCGCTAPSTAEVSGECNPNDCSSDAYGTYYFQSETGSSDVCAWTWANSYSAVWVSYNINATPPWAISGPCLGSQWPIWNDGAAHHFSPEDYAPESLAYYEGSADCTGGLSPTLAVSFHIHIDYYVSPNDYVTTHGPTDLYITITQ
jgi:hypothetical protein